MKEEQLIAEVLYGEETADRSRYALYENGTYMVISKFAYLIGVPFHIFENEHEPPKMEWYEALEKDSDGKRSVCAGDLPRAEAQATLHRPHHSREPLARRHSNP